DVPAAFALRTLNLICGDVTHRRPVTMAFANSRCVPSPTVALFHGLSHGAPFPSQATWTLSTYHLTCVAPAPLAVAALSTITPDTVEPDAGASTVTSRPRASADWFAVHAVVTAAATTTTPTAAIAFLFSPTSDSARL